MSLDLHADVADLTAQLVDVESVSGNEAGLADQIEAALLPMPHLAVERDGNVVIARTAQDRQECVVLAGHIDTVPVAGNLPSRLAGDTLFGCGTTDMKSGVAVQLKLAATVPAPVRDVTYVFYDCEEVESQRNGLGRIARTRPQALAGDFAILLEPTEGMIEGGCQGTLQAKITISGRRAHSARSWMGVTAIHGARQILEILTGYEPRRPVVDGLEYHEGLNAVGITGGVASNVIPDECVIAVNYRFAPDRSLADAESHLREVFDGFDVAVADGAPGARPGLDRGTARSFVTAVGASARAKLGWTDVARFSELGIPAVNYGPGDPLLAHTPDERVTVGLIHDCEQQLHDWLTS